MQMLLCNNRSYKRIATDARRTMPTKNIFILVFCLCILTFNAKAALKCYSCTDINAGPCFRPRKEKANAKECDWNQIMVHDLEPPENELNSTGFQCFTVQGKHASGITAVHRGCVPRSYPNFCHEVHSILEIPGVTTVNICKVCDESLCNGGRNQIFTFIYIILCLLCCYLF